MDVSRTVMEHVLKEKQGVLVSDAARYVTGMCLFADGGNAMVGPAVLAPRVAVEAGVSPN